MRSWCVHSKFPSHLKRERITMPNVKIVLLIMMGLVNSIWMACTMEDNSTVSSSASNQFSISDDTFQIVSNNLCYTMPIDTKGSNYRVGLTLESCNPDNQKQSFYLATNKKNPNPLANYIFYKNDEDDYHIIYISSGKTLFSKKINKVVTPQDLDGYFQISRNQYISKFELCYAVDSIETDLICLPSEVSLIRQFPPLDKDFIVHPYEYQLVNQLTQRCYTVPSNIESTGGTLEQEECDKNNLRQQFKFFRRKNNADRLFIAYGDKSNGLQIIYISQLIYVKATEKKTGIISIEDLNGEFDVEELKLFGSMFDLCFFKDFKEEEKYCLYSKVSTSRVSNSSTVDPVKFKMVVSSDPQLFWECNDQECLKMGNDEEAQGKLSNEWQVASVDKVAKEADQKGYPFEGVIINGDLTAYGHQSQFDKFREYWYKNSWKVWPGLGNHDYENNVNDTFQNKAARRMVDWFYQTVSNLPIIDLDARVDLDSFSKETKGSLSYSWDIGDFHFVQLNNHPAYETTFEGYRFIPPKMEYVTITQSLDWLENDLKATKKKYILLNFHDSDSVRGNKKFLQLLSDTRIKAVFTGHIHQDCGWISNFDATNEQGAFLRSVPIFRSGSAEFSKFLRLDFANLTIKVDCISSVNGGVNLLNSSTIYLD